MIEPQSWGQSRPVDWAVTAMLDELDVLSDRLRHGLPDPDKPSRRWSYTLFDLFAAARARSRGKLPPPARGHRGAGPSTSPTEGQALALVVDDDPDLKRWHSARTDVEVALNYLRHAVDELAKATPAERHPTCPEPACRVCGDRTIYASERCRWCYDRWLEFGVDMPPRIVKWRKAGKRITSTMIRAELEEATA